MKFIEKKIQQISDFIESNRDKYESDEEFRNKVKARARKWIITASVLSDESTTIPDLEENGIEDIILSLKSTLKSVDLEAVKSITPEHLNKVSEIVDVLDAEVIDITILV